MCRRVTAHNTPEPWALGRDGLAHFGSSAAAWQLSRYARWAGRDGSPRPHPATPRPMQDGPTPVRSGDRATFFSCVLGIRTSDPVFRPLPIGLQLFDSTADGFIAPQALGHAVRIAHLRRQGQRPHPRGLALGAWRLMQAMLEAVTIGGIQRWRDGLRTIRLLPQALHALGVKGLDDVADRLDGTAHKLRNGFR